MITPITFGYISAFLAFLVGYSLGGLHWASALAIVAFIAGTVWRLNEENQ